MKKLSAKGKRTLLVILFIIASFSIGRTFGIYESEKLYDDTLKSAYDKISELQTELKKRDSAPAKNNTDDDFNIAQEKPSSSHVISA
jgi:hypothetical protein